MIYEIKAIAGIPRKLQAVKALKELTGLGLRDAKDVINHLCEKEGNMKTINTINPNDKRNIELLKECNIIFGDSREDKLDNMLLKYRVNVIIPQMTYKIFEGEVEVIDGSVIMTIIDGSVLDSNCVIYGDYKTDITNTKLTIDFKNVIIEEPM